VNFRLTADVAALDVISFTIRIAAPQVERNDRISPYITTTTGAASRVTGQPSLLIVPQLTRAGFVYPQLPVVSGADFTFTRATTATRVNASGLIESVASGLLRLDYPVTGGCPAALIEPSGTNIMAQSETLSVSGNWSRVNVLVTGGAIASPDGLASGTLIVATSGNIQHAIDRNAATTVASGAVVTTSCFLKAHGTNNFAQLVIGGFAFSPVNSFANFNLTGSGSVTAGNYTSAFIQNYGNGWYRCGFTVTAAASGTPSCFIVPIIASGTTRDGVFAGNGNGVYAWGFQVETGAIPTSYIPTTAASATRAADVCSVSGVSGYIGQTEGTIYWEGESLASGAQDIIAINQSVTNSVTITKFSTNVYRCLFYASGASVSVIDTVVKTGFVKIAFAYKSGDIALFINGVQIGSTNTTAFTFSGALSSIIFGPSSYYSGRLDQRCRAAAIYTTRLSNDQLANITRLT
jgi:hypothetical protein